MNIDYKKLGYRWRGYYSPDSAYNDKDVVFKEGAAFYYDTNTNAFKLFTRGQIEAISKGEIIVGGDTTTAAGFNGEYLFVRNGAVQFDHPIDRNGTKVAALVGKASTQHSYSYGSHRFSAFIMTDGSVRTVGRTYEGQMGVGDKDQGQGYYTPLRVNFPRGTKPAKRGWYAGGALFIQDSSGQVWASGSNEQPGVSNLSDYYTDPGAFVEAGGMKSMSEYSDIGDDIIKDIYHFYDFESGYHCLYGLCENGRVYSWGHDPNNILGHPVESTGTCYKARLIEFTKDHPIVHVGSDAHTVTGMIDVDGNLWTIGSRNYNYHGNHISEFRKVEIGEKVVDFQGHSCRGHWSNYSGGHRLGSLILTESGRLLGRGNGWGQVGWGTPGLDTSNSFIDDRHLIAKNVKKFWWKHGGYATLIVQTFDDRFLFRGYIDYYTGLNDNVNGTAHNFEPTSATDFDTTAKYQMMSDYYNGNIDKMLAMMGNLRTSYLALTKNGRVFADGLNNQGQRGTGVTTSYVIGYAGLGNNGNLAYLDALPDHFMPIHDKVVDIAQAGYCYYHEGASGPDRTYMTNYMLTEHGDVFATGNGGYGLTGSHQAYDAYVPTKLNF